MNTNFHEIHYFLLSGWHKKQDYTDQDIEEI